MSEVEESRERQWDKSGYDQCNFATAETEELAVVGAIGTQHLHHTIVRCLSVLHVYAASQFVICCSAIYNLELTRKLTRATIKPLTTHSQHSTALALTAQTTNSGKEIGTHDVPCQEIDTQGVPRNRHASTRARSGHSSSKQAAATKQNGQPVRCVSDKHISNQSSRRSEQQIKPV